MSFGKWKNQANILKERNPVASEGGRTCSKGRGGSEGSERVDDICSEIRPLGVKDMKRDRVKAVQFKHKATAEEPKKINEAKNGGFEVEFLENEAVAMRQRKGINARKG